MGAKRVVYFVDTRGRSPVLEDLQKLTDEEQKKVLAYVSFLRRYQQGEVTLGGELL